MGNRRRAEEQTVAQTAATSAPARGVARPEGPPSTEHLSSYVEDEISLVDLWPVLERRRFVLAAAVLACVLAGLWFAFLRPQTYAFTTTIQIGRIVGLPGLAETVGRVPINEILESPETVVAKLNEGYIPKVLAKYVNEADDRTPPKIQATRQKQSQVVLIESEVVRIESEATEKDSELHLTLHNKILAILLEDHGNLIGNYGKALELQVTRAQKNYESLSDEARVLANRVKLLDDTQVLLEKQIAEIQGLLSTATSTLDRAPSEVGDAVNAVMFLMVGNDILQNRTRLAALEERLHIGLPEARSTLEMRLADVKRDMAMQPQKMSAIEAKVRSIRETRVILGPVRSLGPVGPGRAVILALAGVLGLFLGIFAAFFAEFLAKTRAAMAERKTTAAREPVVRGG